MSKKNTNIKERVLYLAEKQEVSKQFFFRKVDLKYSNFTGKSKESDLNSKAVAEILLKYPNINPLWLLTGEGEMLKQEQPKQEVSNIDYKEKYYKVLEEKDILSQQIITLQQQLLGNTSNMEDNMNRSVG
ncbi:hypothetical protein PL373_18575 [Tenacibaculum maritimum]|nr:hypothetical protein [Tenacibaculum maritimum]MDB0603095.1 hypothetical protein [Tenacibaculum maritimum]MDB0611665.1 hypothetical protein [Tenacibaculum maritimum]